LINSDYFYDYIMILTANNHRYIPLPKETAISKRRAMMQMMLNAIQEEFQLPGYHFATMTDTQLDSAWAELSQIPFQIIAQRKSVQAMLFAQLLEKYANQYGVSNVHVTYLEATNHKKWKSIYDFYLYLDDEVTHTSWGVPGLP
jgi:hypothetical protein